MIAETIANTLGARDIVVETVFITDFSFSPAFASQIESKVVAFQKYLTEQNNLLEVKVIANQTVVQSQAAARSNVAKANGESQAIKIISSQLKQSPEYLQWLSINRWNCLMPSQVVQFRLCNYHKDRRKFKIRLKTKHNRNN